jgi:hypothetical protein
MIARCTGEPISWLALERYHLDELSAPEKQPIAEHLAACRACAVCLERIRQDDGVALPVVHDPPASALGGVPPPPVLFVRAKSAGTAPRGAAVPRAGALAALASGALGLAAAIAVALHHEAEQPTRAPSNGERVKGTSIAFSVVREDGERIDGEAGVYRDGDRFKAIVTCPPGLGGWFDLVVYDETGASFPVEPTGDFRCGNAVPLPGAFRLTGRGPEEVCLVWTASGVVDRMRLASGALPEQAMCKKLWRGTVP